MIDIFVFAVPDRLPAAPENSPKKAYGKISVTQTEFHSERRRIIAFSINQTSKR